MVRQPHNRCSIQRPQRGVALLMVVFMIALASALLISLTDSTYVAMRLNSAAEHRIKAEYILKSAVSVAQVLLKTDITSYDDPQQDAWMAFADGREVPGDMLGLTEPNIRVTLMIASKSGKIPLAMVWQASNPTATTWRDIVTALFRILGFDTPAPNTNTSSSAPFVNAEEMVANLIDYLDLDQTNYQQNGFASGVEANLPDDVQFRNGGTIDSLASELASIPGFTPGRIQKILPFVYVSIKSVREVNLNAAPYEVVAAMTDSTSAVQLLAYRQNQGPFKNVVSDLQNCGVTITGPRSGIFSVSGTLYEVIAKVEYGTAAFMASAELSGASGKLPTITNFQVY